MKIRYTGTKEELKDVIEAYTILGTDPTVKYVTISRLYPNDKMSGLYRLYVEIEYRNIDISDLKHLEDLLSRTSFK